MDLWSRVPHGMVIDKLIEHEESLADLYATFRTALPEAKELWAKMVLEEKAHADVLRALGAKGEAKKVMLDERKFNVEAVQSSINYAQAQAKRVADEGTTLLKALSMAMDIENSALENRFFAIFDSDDASMQAEFTALREHTQKHRALLLKHLDDFRRTGGAMYRGYK